MTKPHTLPDGTAVTATLSIEARLTHNAHAAQRPVDHQGHFAPALCMQVESLDGTRLGYVEQHFKPEQHDECDRLAKSLKRGAVVMFEIDLRKLTYKANGIENLQIRPAPAAPAPEPNERDIFAQAAPVEQVHA